MADYDKLAKESGPRFDRAFASHMVMGHEKDIAEYKKEAKRSDAAGELAEASRLSQVAAIEQVLQPLGFADHGNTHFLAAFPFMPPENVRSWLTEMGVLAARPAAFGLFAIYGVLWITFGDGLEWHSLATLATWGMTLVIQRAEHRDTQAIHAKLDELLKATGRANNDLVSIDKKDAEEIEREREKVQRS